MVRENIDMPLLKYFTLAVALSRCTQKFCEEDGTHPAACVAEVSNEAPEAAEPTGEGKEPADAADEAPAAEATAEDASPNEAAATEQKPPCPPGVRDTVGEGNPNQGGWGHSCAWVGFNLDSCADDEAFLHCEATCRKCVPVDDAPAEPAEEPADEPAAATREDEAAPEPTSGAAAMTRLCRAKEDGQYAPVTRAISEEDLVAPEDDVERGPTLEDKRRMLD